MRRILSLAAALVLGGCQSRAPLRLGIVLDADGENGAALAAIDINAAGGIHGRPLELRALHSASVSTAARVALAGADTLVSDPSILGVVGHTNSSASLAAAQVYNEHHTVQIAPTTTTPLYSGVGRYSYRLVASDIHQGGFLARVVRMESNPRVAVLYVNDDYGRALHQAFVDSLARDGITPAYDAPYGEGSGFTDADDLARTVASANPTMLVWLGRSPELTTFLPLLRPLVANLHVLASDGFGGTVAETGAVAALVGVQYVRLIDLANPSERARMLRARYQKQFKLPATDQALLSYQAVMLLARAIADAGPNREAICDYIAEIGGKRPAISGIAGPVSFDKNGDPPPVYYLAEVTAAGSRPLRVASVGNTAR